MRNALDSDEGSSIGGPEVTTVALPPALQVTSGPEKNRVWGLKRHETGRIESHRLSTQTSLPSKGPLPEVFA